MEQVRNADIERRVLKIELWKEQFESQVKKFERRLEQAEKKLNQTLG
jgi:predicted  nucleic acid-binding Zn-ribbon protein